MFPRIKIVPLAGALVLLTMAATASGHYLWLTIDGKTGGHDTANIYFEEAPAPGDGSYLDPFVKGCRTWIRTIQNPRPQALATKEVTQPKLRWLSSELPQPAPRSIDSYGKFGVYRYGKTDVLLHYYARNLDVQTHEDLHELARAEHMALDVVPHDHGDQMDLLVLWKGEPAANRTVYIRGPKGFQANMKTSAAGKVRFKLSTPGRYTFRTSVEEPTPGQEGKQAYSLVRHNATMVMTLPLQK